MCNRDKSDTDRYPTWLLDVNLVITERDTSKRATVVKIPDGIDDLDPVAQNYKTDYKSYSVNDWLNQHRFYYYQKQYAKK